MIQYDRVEKCSQTSVWEPKYIFNIQEHLQYILNVKGGVSAWT